MTTIPSSLLKKTHSLQRITSLFATEVKVHLFAFSLIYIFVGAFLLANGDAIELRRDSFALFTIAFFAFYCALEYVFRLFVKGKVAALFSLLPAAVLFLLLKDSELVPYLHMAVILAVLFRLIFVFLPKRELIMTYGCFVLDIAAVVLCISFNIFTGVYFADRLLFVFLVVLTLSAIQKIFFEKNKDEFPFYYFILLCIIVSLIPMGKKPIDWTPVVYAGERLVKGVVDAFNDASYYLSLNFDKDSYSAGYSSLNVTGNKTKGSEKIQLLLGTDEKPYILYQDEETEAGMMMRRFVYLPGGRGIEKSQLLSLIRLLYENDVDKGYAELFSKVSHLDIEYVYLDTKDEIVPANAFSVLSGKNKIEEGTGSKRHKKGYKLKTSYIDIDYGSPYLVDLYRNATDSFEKEFDYDTACKYARRIYGINLEDIMDAQEFDNILSSSDTAAYMDISGADQRLQELADTITAGAENDFDKCKLIETYLRQYTYNTNAVGGHDPKSNMSTAEGMCDIASRFLFETNNGYCVHYASSMVMLLRLSGIPARAVSGYRYAFPFEEASKYEVSANLAHTWPEAYIEGAGWVPFEPTSAYSTASDFSWHRKAKEVTIPDYEHYYSGMGTLPPTNIGQNAETTEEKVTTKVFNVAWPVVLSIVLIIVLLILGTKGFGFIRYRLSDPAKRLILDTETIKKGILKLSKEDFNDRGLLSDYVNRAPKELQKDISKVFDIYYRIIYGNDKAVLVSPGENELARRLGKDLAGYKRKNR